MRVVFEIYRDLSKLIAGMPFKRTVDLGIERSQAAPLPGTNRRFGLTANRQLIFVMSPGFQVFVSAGSVGP